VLGIVFAVLAGLYSTLHLPALIDFNALYSEIKTGVELVGIVSTAVLILKMPHWGTLYMLGWIVGILYFWYLGLVSASDFLFYIVPSVVILAWRVYNRASYAEYSGGYLA
jgi:ABC-type transport system involved in Fe-S cluster assembly fused permease/ATPase subunit